MTDQERIDVRDQHIDSLKDENTQLSRELDEAKQALSDAAREINCAGPVAHRIRILKQEHQAELAEARRELDELRNPRTDLDHGMNCPGLIPGEEEACVCGLYWRILLSKANEQLAEARQKVAECIKSHQKQNAYVDKLEGETEQQRQTIAQLVEALQGLQDHCADQGWWLKKHAMTVMDQARAALSAAQRWGENGSNK